MSDYLSDEEQVARLRSWWAANGTWLIATIVLAIAVAVGWRWYQSNRAETIARGSDLYAQFQSAEPAVQAALADELADTAAGTAYPVMARLALAAAALEADPADPAAAEQELQRALDLADDETLADLTRLRLARTQMQLGERDAALATLAAVRSTGYRSMVAELKGDMHMAAGERAEAHEAYNSALAALETDDRRPVLELKAGTTAAPLAGPVAAPSVLEAAETEAASTDESDAPSADSPDA
ncbi:MAG: tetratricopeptide repeat protein [Pseudomonadota bacterium]